MRKLLIAMAAIGLFILALSGVAFAASDASDLGGLLNDALDAFKSGDFAIGVIASVVMAVGLLRRFGGSRLGFLSHKLVAPLLVFLSAYGFAMLLALQAGEAFTAALAWGTFKTSLMAAGGYSLLKPYLDKLQAIAPAWMDPLFALVGVVFQSRQQALRAKAKAAGEDAVAAHPSEGFDVDVKEIP